MGEEAPQEAAAAAQDAPAATDLANVQGLPAAKRQRVEAAPPDGAPPPEGKAAAPDRKAAGGAGPPLYAFGGYVDAGGGWWAHGGGEWLYSVEEKTYFHLPTGQLHLATDSGVTPFAPTLDAEKAAVSVAGDRYGVAQGDPISAAANGAVGATAADVFQLRGRVKWFNAKKGFGFIEPADEGKDLFVHRNQIRSEGDDVFASLDAGALVGFNVGETDDGRPCAVNVQVLTPEEDKEGDKAEDGDGDDASSSGESVEIDVEEELRCGLYSDKGPGKEVCEDFAVEKVKLPITVLGETASCFFFGVFDGHGGKHCAEYVSDHLAKNVLAKLRDRTKSATDEVAMRTALLGGFKQTEHNFLHKAKRGSDMSGSTACTFTVFGPDEQMRLRLFLANLGDSRAVLGKMTGQAVRLTEDHKPNLPAEKKRVDAAGGSVAEVAGIWRVILPAERRLPGTTLGLAVSRSFGDKEFKGFKGADIVGAEPEITVHEVDWDGDDFVIIASDGIWDVLSDREAVRIVQQRLRQKEKPQENADPQKEAAVGAEGVSLPKKQSIEEKAAEALVKKAREKGSKDDATAMVVKFGWLKLPEDVAVAEMDGVEEEEEEGERLRTERQALEKEGEARMAEMQTELGADTGDTEKESTAAKKSLDLDSDDDEEDDGAAEPMGLSIMPKGLFDVPSSTADSEGPLAGPPPRVAPAQAAFPRSAVVEDDDIFAAAADLDAEVEDSVGSGAQEPAADMAGGLFDELPAPQEAQTAAAWLPALPTSGMGAMPVSAMPVGALDAAALAVAKAKKGKQAE